MADQKQTAKEQENFKYFIRVANTDIDGSRQIVSALRKIKGVNFMFSNMVCNVAGIDKLTKAGTLTDEEVKKIDNILSNPLKYNAPSWMLNRRKNYEDGEDYHLLTSDLSFAQDRDIKNMKKIRSYRGIRHGLGLPVRGQRTKSNFRKNKGKAGLGVIKKKELKRELKEGKEKR